ncbi:unnamed protein product [Bursaphelenchus okinawaensis]|uniref:Uncharacterized protein n=1 Tax=Bursaphelenchus okinawaensis TaxID=465554 RepID=A0A811LPA5_9BILA|nr:unnamed protein product [Bursaphelenchus okinawaensis]CAG9126782.1 unnamed protein product [Bursaphelenchus okinawaensis]
MGQTFRDLEDLGPTPAFSRQPAVSPSCFCNLKSTSEMPETDPNQPQPPYDTKNLPVAEVSLKVEIQKPEEKKGN